MDDEKKAQVSSLVKLMLKEGTSRSVIKETLKQTGVTEDDAESLLLEAGSPTQPEKKEAPASEQPDEEEKSAAEEKEPDSESIESLSFSSAPEKAKPAEKPIPPSSRASEDLSEITLLKYDVRKIKELLIEMKPMIAALSDLNHKILEENQKVLIRLKKE